METWIRRACRQRAYRQVVFWLFLTFCGIAAIVETSDYWANFFSGPYRLSPAEIENITDARAEPRQLVRVTGEKVIDTGLQEITTETRNGVKQGSYTSASYYALILGDRFLIVKNVGQPGLTVEGQLEQVPFGFSRQMFPDPDDAQLMSRMLPVYLNSTENYRLAGYVAIGAGITYLLLLWRFGLRAWKNVQDISQHPVVRRVEAWTDATQLGILAEREITVGMRHRSGPVIITDNFLLHRGFFEFNLLALEDLLWMYRKTTQSYYYFIPMGKSHEAVFVFYGGSARYVAKQKLVDQVLLEVANRSPWAVLGYTDEIKKAFKKDTAGFCAVVEERRREVPRRATTPPPPVEIPSL